MRILVDLDEVLADFTGAALRAHGTTRAELESRRAVGRWCMAEALGISIEEFWRPILAEGDDFWHGIQPLPWMDDVLNQVASLVDDLEGWAIVSSPASGSDEYGAKVDWIKRYVGNVHFCLTPFKWLLSQKGSVLIDDSEKNVLTFAYGPKGKPPGGASVLFPSMGNALYRFADNPTSQLTRRIRRALQLQERRNALHVQKRQRCLQGSCLWNSQRGDSYSPTAEPIR